MIPLTADVERVAKRGRDDRVQLEYEVLLLGDVIVARLDMLRDPGTKVVTN